MQCWAEQASIFGLLNADWLRPMGLQWTCDGHGLNKSAQSCFGVIVHLAKLVFESRDEQVLWLFL